MNHPPEVTVTLPWDEAQALADWSLAGFWVAKVKRACQRLTEAMRAAQEAPTAVEDPGRRSSGPDELPAALRLAREARVAPVPLKVATPSRLYHLAVEELGAGDDATRRYRHAMIEAGYMVPTQVERAGAEDFQPCDPCPICNWSPTK